MCGYVYVLLGLVRIILPKSSCSLYCVLLLQLAPLPMYRACICACIMVRTDDIRIERVNILGRKLISDAKLQVISSYTIMYVCTYVCS